MRSPREWTFEQERRGEGTGQPTWRGKGGPEGQGKTRRAESWSQGTECSQEEGGLGPSNTAEGQVCGDRTDHWTWQQEDHWWPWQKCAFKWPSGSREEAVETVRSAKGHQRKQQNGPGWRRASETQDAKWAASGPSEAHLPSTVPWQHPELKPQCSGPHPGAKGYPCLHHLCAAPQP